MVEYKECYVAFLDILGFKELINNSNCNVIHDIFQSVLNFEVRAMMKSATVYKEIKYTIMSDSIIVYIETKYANGFVALADACSQIQMKLLQNNPPILLRGGIERGTLYHKDNILFGQGLTKAYLLENNAATYPRIIFTEELRQLGLANTDRLYVFDYNNMFYRKDSDEFYYINFLNMTNYILASNAKNREDVEKINNDFFDKLLEHVEKILSAEINLSVRGKYLWLKKKIKEQIKCMPSVKSYFEEKDRKEQEERDKRFGETLKGE